MSHQIRVKDKIVGDGNPTLIIAEIGSNHDQKLSQAKELIDIASECKVDAVKFQLFKAENFYPKNDPMFSVMKKNECPREWISELLNYSKTKELIFLASPFDKEAIDLLYSLDISAFKIASSETANMSFLRYAASKGKPLIISTGMSNIADICEAVDIVYSTGNKDIILLHCTSLYPTEVQDVNLRAMETIKKAFRLPVGYSDHTLGIHMPIAAVARSACVVEKHFTLSRKLDGPDHSYAIEPDELKQMVSNIRDIENGLGTYDKQFLTKEKKIARRTSIAAKYKIPKDTVLINDMLVVKRPATGIEPRFIKALIGQKSTREIDKDEIITWNMLY